MADNASAQALELLQNAQDTDGDARRALLSQRRALQRERAEANKQLKLIKKKHTRILEKAKTLSNEKLMSIIVARCAKAKAKARGG